MSLITGVGFSNHRNPADAGREAAQQAMAKAGIDQPDFVFLFGTVGYNQRILLQTVREVTGGAPLSGCSGEGLIVNGAVYEFDLGVVVSVVKSDEIRLSNAHAVGMSTDAMRLGQTLGDALALGDATDALMLIAFADGLTLDFDAMLRGLMHKCPSQHAIPLVGGTTSDERSFSAATYQYCDDDVLSDGAVATLIRGKGEVFTGTGHGCVKVGDELTVTKADANRILEIDHRPALKVIDEFLTVEERDKDWTKTNVFLAVGIKASASMKRGDDDYLIRFMPMRDEEAVWVSTEISEGTRFFMTRRDQDKIAHGNQRLTEEIQKGLAGRNPRFMLQIECIGRGKVFFEDSKKQRFLRDMQAAVSKDANWFGLYTHGEFGPAGGINRFHNYSLVLAAIA